MQRKIIKTLIVICTFIFSLAIFCEISWAKPIMKFDNTEFDFGKVIQGESISHEFSFKNIGDEPLTIKDVRAG